MFKNLKKYYNIIEKNRFRFLLIFTIAIISEILALFPVKFTGNITDAIKNKTLTSDYLKNSLIMLLFVVIAIYLLQALYNFLIFSTPDYVCYKLKSKITSKILKQEPPFFLKFNPSNIITRATSDSMMVSEMTGYGLLTAIESIAVPVVNFYFMAKLNIWLMIIAVISLPIMVFIVLKITKLQEVLNEKTMQSEEVMNEYALENFKSIKVIKAFYTKDNRLKEFLNLVKKNHDYDLKLNNVMNLYAPMISVTLSIFSVITIVVGAFLINYNKITLGELVMQTMLIGRLSWPSYAIADFISVYKSANVSFHRIDDMLNYKEKNKTNNTIILNDINTISLKNLSFKYPNSKSYALKDINLDVKNGQKIGIVGKTGSGKTTLLRLLVMEYSDYDGDFYLNNKNIQSINLDSYRQMVGYVPQEHFLFSKSIKDNILFYRNGDYEKAIKLSDFKKDLPLFKDDINTLCGELGVTLSGGQKQRVSLARATLLNPKILILDDVLSAVDNTTEKNILDNLEDNFKSSTLFINSHKLSAVKNADEIIVLDNGKIIERGSFEELMGKNGWFSTQYKIQEVQNEEK